MTKKLIIWILVCACAALLFACKPAQVQQTQEAQNAGQITVTDARGKEITFDGPVDNVVCLINSALNDLYMLGAADVVTGIDLWTYNNTQTYEVLSQIDERIANKELPAVDGNVEAIVALKPDVVLIWALAEDQIKALEEQGIKVVGIQVNTFDDVYTKLHTVAKLVGKEQRAQEIETYAKGQLKSIADKTAELKEKKTGIFVWGPSLLDLAGNPSTGQDLLALSGIDNAARDVAQEHFVANMEQVLQWNPQSIIMWNNNDADPQDYLGAQEWQTVRAVQDGNVFEVTDDMTFFCDLWTVKYFFAVEAIAKSVYPELFNDLDLAQVRTDMMMALYGKDVTVQ